MNGLDLPPVWLAGFIALAWALSKFVPGMELDLPWQGILALIFLIVGLVLMGLAVLEMMRAKTTIIPRRKANALVTSGVFRISRNPIYLGDTFVLTAAVLWFDMGPALVLVPVFVWLIRRRFIEGEESGLTEKFGSAFDEWKRKTRRWI